MANIPCIITVPYIINTFQGGWASRLPKIYPFEIMLQVSSKIAIKKVRYYQIYSFITCFMRII